jgi:hypothetical protein
VGLRRAIVIGGALVIGACPDNITENRYILSVSPTAATLFVDDSQRFDATLRDAEGNPVPATFTWEVSNPAVVTVDAAGLVRAVGPGSAVVRVTAEGTSATASVTVAQDDGSTMTIAPQSARVPVNSFTGFTVTVFNRHGDTVPSTPAWSSTNAAVATVDAEGRARGVAPGAATIRATVGSLTAEAQLTVEPRVSTAVLVGAGDIASCDNSGDERTADLLDDIAGIVFTVGDNAYPNATPEEYDACYDPSWGRHKDRTRPAAGNHEYFTFGAAGYFGYFGAAAGDPARGYYSYDAGAWHVIVLNSNLQMGASSPQVQWLRRELADNPTRCTLAYWHHPRFSSGEHGSSGMLEAIWNALYEANADLVLVGHDHLYERFAPQTPAGQLDLARGIRQITVGTGGGGLYEFEEIAPNSEVRGNQTKGVLKLTLHADRYDWEFVPVAGGDFRDSGSASCH